MDVPHLFDIAENMNAPVKLVAVITNKGTGKTTSCMKRMLTRVAKHQKQGVWIRNTKEELKNSAVVSSFNSEIINLKLQDHYFAREEGVMYKNNVWDRTELAQLKIMFANMNKSHNISSQTALQNVEWIVYDEVINREFNKPNMELDFINLIKTMQRKMNAKVIVLGNAHDSDNDILNSLGANFDWLSGKTQVIYREKQRMLAIYMETYVIRESSEAEQWTNDLFMFSEEVQDFIAGKVAVFNSRDIINTHMLADYNEKFQPLWIYEVNDSGHSTITSFAVGLYDDYLIIEKLVGDKYSEIPHLAYRSVDKTSYNTFIYDYKDLRTVEWLLDYYSNGKIKFSSVYAREMFTMLILERLKFILQEQKKKYQ